MKLKQGFSKEYLELLIENSIPGSEQYLMLMTIKNEMENKENV